MRYIISVTNNNKHDSAQRGKANKMKLYTEKSLSSFEPWRGINYHIYSGGLDLKPLKREAEQKILSSILGGKKMKLYTERTEKSLSSFEPWRGINYHIYSGGLDLKPYTIG